MSQQHICKNCGNQFVGKYCNQCGEKVYGQHDKSLLHFFEEGLHFITHFEGTFFNTLKALFTKPGQLSFDYCGGIRKKYFKPLSFFLLLIVLYLLFPIFEGLNMKLMYYARQHYYGQFAASQIAEKLQQTGLSEAALADVFHAKAEKVSKFMLLVILPLTAVFFYCTGFFKRQHFFDHMVFSTEINAVYLLWGFLIMPGLLTIFSWVAKWITGNHIPLSDGAIGIIIYTVLGIYLYKAAKKFYGFKWWQCLIQVILFMFAHAFIVYTVYKFLLFITVIKQIH
jgi:hypothetical protein